MSGFEAITHHNGWAMAIVGATIVLSGLTILSLIISQLHKLVGLIEKKQPPPTATPPDPEEETNNSLTDGCPASIEATVDLYRPLIEELDEQFLLIDLYSLADRYHLPHPHLSIRCLRDAGKIVAQGDGVFVWNV